VLPPLLCPVSVYNSVFVQKTPDVVDKVVKHMASFPTKYDKEEINRLVQLFEMCEKQDRDLLAVIVQDHSNLMQYLDQKDLQAIQNDLSKLEPRAQRGCHEQPRLYLANYQVSCDCPQQKEASRKEHAKPADLEPEVVANNIQPSAASDEFQESRDSPENGDAPDPTAVNDDDADTIDLSSASASNPSRPQPELEPNWNDHANVFPINDSHQAVANFQGRVALILIFSASSMQKNALVTEIASLISSNGTALIFTPCWSWGEWLEPIRAAKLWVEDEPLIIVSKHIRKTRSLCLQAGAMQAMVIHKGEKLCHENPFSRNSVIFNTESEFPPYANVIVDTYQAQPAPHVFRELTARAVDALLFKYTRLKDTVIHYNPGAESPVPMQTVRRNRKYVGLARSDILASLRLELKEEISKLSKEKKLLDFSKAASPEELQLEEKSFRPFALGAMHPTSTSEEKFYKQAETLNTAPVVRPPWWEADAVNKDVECQQMKLELRPSKIPGPLRIWLCRAAFLDCHPLYQNRPGRSHSSLLGHVVHRRGQKGEGDRSRCIE